MRPSQIAILGYAVLYFVLASDVEAGNISQRYPVIYIGLSMLDQILVVAGVVLFGLKAEADFAKFWRFLFPLMILELTVGFWFDAIIPLGAFEPQWWLNVAQSLWLLAPAYYFNFRVARYRHVEQADAEDG
jgi:hypothetical protein